MATVSMTGQAANPGDGGGTSPLFVKLRFALAGLAGVLVLVPPLIKGVGEIYKEFNNLPRNEVEAVNAEMFRKHFGQPPVHEADVPVSTPSGQVTVPRISVYESGDIWVKYGEVSQWFRFPQKASGRPVPAERLGGWHWPSAQAQTARPAPGPALRPPPREAWVGDGVLQREVRHPDGSTETWRINTNTGRVVRVASTPPTVRGVPR